jgi:hypothetical protein
MFGLVHFRINRVSQNTLRGGVSVYPARSRVKVKKLMMDVDIRQWILADDRDVGHQMYTDNDIVSLVLSEKSVQDDSNESNSDEATTEVISHNEGLEALERALLYVEQHSKATPTDVIFMKR